LVKENLINFNNLDKNIDEVITSKDRNSNSLEPNNHKIVALLDKKEILEGYSYSADIVIIKSDSNNYDWDENIFKKEHIFIYFNELDILEKLRNFTLEEELKIAGIKLCAKVEKIYKY
jgi:hypothetical protein